MSEIDQYDYPLPKHLIAQQPTTNRVDARLMVVDRASGTVAHEHIRELPLLLRAGDALVLNETKVLPARLVGRRRATGGHWEGLFLASDENRTWKLLCKARGKLFAGERIELVTDLGPGALDLELVAKEDSGAWFARPIAQPMLAERNDLELLELAGRVPLPHYIRSGEMVASDRERYQTVFARHPGSVAAPTAGLHFTTELLRQIEAAGVETVKVTLHVGLDTFRPIAVDSLAEHPMHSEWGQIDQPAVDRLLAQGSRRPDHRGRHDDNARVGNGRRRWHACPLERPDPAVHPSRPRVSRRRRPAHQFSFAADDAVGSGPHLRRRRIDACRLRRSDPARIPLLQLRRRDADFVSAKTVRTIYGCEKPALTFCPFFEATMRFESAGRQFRWLARVALPALLALPILFLPMDSGQHMIRVAMGEPLPEPSQSKALDYPQIVKKNPERGDTDVDPAVQREISVTFDRDMSKGMSWTGSPPLFPEIDGDLPIRWLDQRTCVLPVKLKKGTYYRVGINSTGFHNFQSVAGVPTPPTVIAFVTKGASDEVKQRIKTPKIVSLALRMDPRTSIPPRNRCRSPSTCRWAKACPGPAAARQCPKRLMTRSQAGRRTEKPARFPSCSSRGTTTGWG